ncbi:MAG: bifunctional folylpolyglutamate synthase/dihydrofolate synthase [Chitinispirillaceae bacterium]|nr:bifunctional folylpolyglutamate synthase/dihydrofolate synthase [Chitinispirillaceae bacterium]
MHFGAAGIMHRDAVSVRRRLFALSARGIKYDLDRMRGAAEACGNPQRAYPCFHVAGTNGKGSVCAFLESCLRAQGFRTGLFTSPHLVGFEERFMVNGRPVDEPVWLDAYGTLQPAIERFRLTFFEASALLSFEIFRREKVAWAVFETGLGGRLDATNVVVPAVSVISRVALDHCEYLGNDLASICSEKLGIVKKGVPLVMAEPGDETLRALVLRYCAEQETSCCFVGTAEAAGRSDGSGGSLFTFDGKEYRISLPGAFQTGNAMLALAALKAAGLSTGNTAAVESGMSAAWLPGRFQTISVRARTTVFDVGHNPDAANAFCRALRERFKAQPACLVLGIMKDKDIAGMTARYAAAARRIICTAPATERAASPETIKNMVPGTFHGEVLASATVALAVEDAFKFPEDIICIAGSFFTVGEAMTYLNVEPYKR